jgi:hypothetical protein
MGTTENDLNELQTGILAGPIYVRSATVELLAREGVMTPEAKANAGFEWLQNFQERGRAAASERDGEPPTA